VPSHEARDSIQPIQRVHVPSASRRRSTCLAWADRADAAASSGRTRLAASAQPETTDAAAAAARMANPVRNASDDAEDRTARGRSPKPRTRSASLRGAPVRTPAVGRRRAMGGRGHDEPVGGREPGTGDRDEPARLAADELRIHGVHCGERDQRVRRFAHRRANVNMETIWIAGRSTPTRRPPSSRLNPAETSRGAAPTAVLSSGERRRGRQASRCSSSPYWRRWRSPRN
jgi:hypothetical protein